MIPISPPAEDPPAFEVIHQPHVGYPIATRIVTEAAKKPRVRNNRTIVVLALAGGLVSLIVMIAVVIGVTGNGAGQVGPGRPGTPMEVNIESLVHAYDAEVAANKTFGGKSVLLTGGVVYKSWENRDGSATVRLGDDWHQVRGYVNCVFSDKDQASSLANMDYAIIVGDCIGRRDGFVTLENCKTVSDIRQYRIVPNVLVNRFESMTPVKSFDPCQANSNDDRDRYRQMLSTFQGSVIELRGMVAKGNVEGEPILYVDVAECHFEPNLAIGVNNLGNSWPIRVRGKVAPMRERQLKLVDCGVCYGH